MIVSRKAQGMLLVMTNVESDHEAEFNLWYDTEHMQERLDVPGFLAVRRYAAVSGPLKYCALYRTESIGTFESDVYRARLAVQSDWSRRILTTFVDPNRLVGQITSVAGSGFGGWFGVLRLVDSHDDSALETAIADIGAARNVIAVRLFEADARLSGPVKEYRPVPSPVFQRDDRLLLIEASDAGTLEPANLEKLCAGVGLKTAHVGTYMLSWGKDAEVA